MSPSYILSLVFLFIVAILLIVFVRRVLFGSSKDDRKPDEAEETPPPPKQEIEYFEQEIELVESPISRAEPNPTSYFMGEGDQIVDSLEELGYFAYTQVQDLENVKQEIATSYQDGKVLSSAFDAETSMALCRRLYFCDGETLFELGGLVDYLTEVKPVFDQLDIPLQWSDEYWSDDASLHTIVLNGKKYDAFRGNPHDSKIWAWATKNFAATLNDQLELHGSDERIYLLGAGMMVFSSFLRLRNIFSFGNILTWEQSLGR